MSDLWKTLARVAIASGALSCSAIAPAPPAPPAPPPAAATTLELPKDDLARALFKAARFEARSGLTSRALGTLGKAEKRAPGSGLIHLLRAELLLVRGEAADLAAADELSTSLRDTFPWHPRVRSLGWRLDRALGRPSTDDPSSARRAAREAQAARRAELEALPEDAAARTELAHLLVEIGLDAETTEALARAEATASDADRVGLLAATAEHHLRSGRFTEAEDALSRARALAPTAPELWFVEAHARARQGRHAEAAEGLRAADLPPSAARALLLADQDERAGEIARAAETLEALPETERSAETAYQRGRLARRRGDDAAARAAFEAAVELDPTHAAQGALFEIDLAAKELDRAQERLDAAIRAHPDDARVVRLWGRAAAERGEHRNAACALVLALQLDPNAPQSFTRLSAFVGQASRGFDPLFSIRDLLDGESDDEAVHLIRAVQVQAEQGGDREASIGHYEALLRLDPRHPIGANNLSFALAATDTEQERAAALIAEARRGPYDVPNLIDSQGTIASLRGRTDDAIAYFEESLALMTPDLRARVLVEIHLAQAHRAAKNTEAGREAVRRGWKQLIETVPRGHVTGEANALRRLGRVFKMDAKELRRAGASSEDPAP